MSNNWLDKFTILSIHPDNPAPRGPSRTGKLERLIFSFSLILVLVLAGNVFAADDPSLVIYYDFEGFGDNPFVLDKSGKGHDATVVGNVRGVIGAGARGSEACQVTDRGSYLDLDGANYPSEDIPTTAMTLAYWVKPEDTGDTQTVFSALAAPHSWCHGGYIRNNQYHAHIGDINNNYIINAYEGTVEYDAWHHMALTWELVPDEYGGGAMYIDGELVAEYGNDFVEAPPGVEAADNWGGGARMGYDVDDSWQFNGQIDEFCLFTRALSADEVLKLMQGISSPIAFGPTPADGSLYPDTWATLSWYPGDGAVSHDVYVSDNFDDVNEGTGDAFRGNQIPTYFVVGFPGFPYPEGLVPGTTYYWRIDEVNEADPNSPWRGDVWSFSIPPRKAYGPNPADGAEFIDPQVTLSWTAGFGAKLHTIYLGDDYDDVNTATEGVSQGSTLYTPANPLESEKVYYWRIDEFDGAATYRGDLWSFTTPGAVCNPRPANGAVDVKMVATLSWTASDSAASHEVYFGTDKEAVRTADTASPEYKGNQVLGTETYDPGKLAWYTTYYWRIDEVDSQGNTQKGPLWSFTTADFISVDDFEDYTDDDGAGKAIWQSWIDGFGVAENGSQAGYLVPPYAEQTFVHSGLQALPLIYNNAPGEATYSEATSTLSYPRDWTESGVSALVIWFRGRSDNAAEPLYVSVANSGGAPITTTHEDLNAAQTRIWTKWVIMLQTLADQGIDLTNVDTIAIGLGTKGAMTTPGGTGTVYIDDIALY
jgi:hypothetical protein